MKKSLIPTELAYWNMTIYPQLHPTVLWHMAFHPVLEQHYLSINFNKELMALFSSTKHYQLFSFNIT